MRELVIERLMAQFTEQIDEDREGLESALDLDLGIVNLDEDEFSIELINKRLNECTDEEVLEVYDYFTGFQG